MSDSPPFKKPKASDEPVPSTSLGPALEKPPSPVSSASSGSSGSIKITEEIQDPTVFRPPSNNCVGIVGYGKHSVVHESPAAKRNETKLEISRPLIFISSDVDNVLDACNYFSLLNQLWLDAINRVYTNNVWLVSTQFARQQQQQHQLPEITAGEQDFIRRFNKFILGLIDNVNDGILESKKHFQAFLKLCKAPASSASYSGYGDMLIYRFLEPVTSVGLEFNCTSCQKVELIMASQLQLVDSEWDLRCLKTMNGEDKPLLPENVPTLAKHVHCCMACSKQNKNASRLVIRSTTYFIMFQVIGSHVANLLDDSYSRKNVWNLVPEHFDVLNLDTNKFQTVELLGLEIELSSVHEKKTGKPTELSHVLALSWFNGTFCIADDLGRRRSLCLLRTVPWSQLCLRFVAGLNNFGPGYVPKRISIKRIFYGPINTLMDPDVNVARQLKF